MPRRTFRLLLAALTLLSLVVTLRPTFGDRPLDSHEALVAQSAREIFDPGGSWLVPTFNGEPRLKKPPLQNWCVAIVSRVVPGASDVSPWVARLPSALAGVALVVLTVLLGRLVYDGRTGLLAGLLALTCSGFFTVFNSARPEMLYAACCTLLILGLSGARVSADRSRAQRSWALLGWLGFALACLAKGPHLPLIIVVAYAIALALEGERGRILRVIRPLSGVLVVLLIPGAWLLGVLLHYQTALDVWYEQMFLYAREDDAGGGLNLLQHLSPFYLYAVPSLALPWVVPFVFGLFVTFERDRPDLRRGRALLWTILFAAVVMSLHVQRREYYLVPVLAPIAVLMARGTIDAIEKFSRTPKGRRLIRGLAIAHVAAAVITFGVVAATHAHPLLPVLLPMGLIGAALVAWLVRAPVRPAPIVLAAAALSLAVPATADSNLWWRERRFDLWDFAMDLKARAAPDEPAYSVGGLESLLVYALDRHITECRALSDIPAPAPGRVAWIVAEPKELKDPNPNLHVELVHAMDAPGSNPRENLVLLLASPPPPPPRSRPEPVPEPDGAPSE